MIRSFIALELNDEETIEKIKSFSERLKKNQAKIKIVEPQNLHLTLKFLGKIHESLAPEIYKILKEEINEKLLQGKTFEYRLKGVGQFNKFSVIWVRLRGNLQFLQDIKDSIENLLKEKLNIEKDKRTEFKAHLTIGRLRKNRINYETFNTLKKIISENKNLEFGKFDISEIKLKKSVLTPQGPIYSDLVF
ncbi:MAG: RNA 2',3'-cyclic phosphodiesterase [Promethearchaeota archaeon]